MQEKNSRKGGRSGGHFAGATVFFFCCMAVVLGGAVILLIHSEGGKEYPGIVIYAVASYTFCKIIFAVINVFRARKKRALSLMIIRDIGYVDACVSILSLQTAMVAQFGGGEEAFARMMNGITGTAVCLMILGLGIYYMLLAGKEQRENGGAKSMIHILVVEDDEKLNRIVCTYLNDSGFQTKGCLNARDAYDEMYNQLYDLIISDIMMPEIDGFEFARTVRKVNKRIPILFMSAKDDLPSKQKGFQLGIDDYMVKPVDLEELVLRVRALLRRANIEMERKITVGNLLLDADGMTAEVDGEEISLTTREFNIIYKLLSYPKKHFPEPS